MSNGASVQLTAHDGHELVAYMAGPADAAASIVIIQEIFGVNVHIRSVVDSYAERGYLAIAPALFDRAERGVDLPYTPDALQRGLSIRNQVSWDTTTADVGAALEHVRRDKPAAVIGYCYGGGVAWLAANELEVKATVCYYGGQIHGYIDRSPACPTLLHFGETDHQVSLDQVEEIRAAHPEVEMHVYEGAGHGFNCDIRDSYHPEASALALERTLAFLHAHGVR